jgi:bifunctional DNA-binding transcriptional regulator/antitoxin component of YhaV-PrlF toxin-antitoxin module
VTRELAELTIGDDGTVALPLGVLAEAGLVPGSSTLACSEGNGRILLRRAEDAMRRLLEESTF